MKRRHFLSGASLAAGAALASSLPKPAIAQDKLEWKMVTSWPRGLPGLATGAERLADRIGKLSGGRLTVKVFAGGELVPALGCFDAVKQGTADMAHDAAYYHIDKEQAAGFFTAVPFGMTVMTIARHTGHFIHDRLARTGETVKKGRLPDIRATNNSNKIRHGAKVRLFGDSDIPTGI